MSEDTFPESKQTSLVMRIDDHTRDRLDRVIASFPDSKGMQAAILRASLKLYLTLAEGDLEAAESHIKRITGRPDLRFELLNRTKQTKRIGCLSELGTFHWIETEPSWRMDEYQDFASIIHEKTSGEISILFTNMEKESD